MVTAAIALALVGSLAQPAPASARKSAHTIWGELFGAPPKPRRLAHAVKVPLPKPRPPDAPKAEAATEARGEPEIPPAIRPPAPPPAASSEHKPAEQATAPAAPEPSACRQALTEDVAIAPSLPPIHDPGGCGGDDLVRLEAIVLPDKHRVAVSPAATLRCPMAAAIADWVRADIAPLAQELGSRLAELDNFESYECRNFNGVKGAHLSEHGHANALDVHGFKLADGREIVLTDRDEPRSLREDMLHSACTRFTTVLGPDSDWHHEDHIHLDLMERHNNYRICQWDVLDPLPKVAPLLPSERPAEAPPRQVANKEEQNKAEAPSKEQAQQPEKTIPAAEAAKPDTQQTRKVGKARRAQRRHAQ